MVKILIGIPTYDGKDYCFDNFISSLKRITYKDADILFIDTSQDNQYLNKIKSLKIPSRKIFVFYEKPSDDKIGNIINARNKIRSFFLDNGYDYLFFIDSDIMVSEDVIEELLQADSDVASGVYLCRQQIDDGGFIVESTIYLPHENEGYIRILTEQEAMEGKIMDIMGCGLGCCLIRRKVLEKVMFRSLNDFTKKQEDVAFCKDAAKLGFTLKVNSRVKCPHVGKNNTLDFSNSISYSFSFG